MKTIHLERDKFDVAKVHLYSSRNKWHLGCLHMVELGELFGVPNLIDILCEEGEVIISFSPKIVGKGEI